MSARPGLVGGTLRTPNWSYHFYSEAPPRSSSHGCICTPQSFSEQHQTSNLPPANASNSCRRRRKINPVRRAEIH